MAIQFFPEQASDLISCRSAFGICRLANRLNISISPGEALTLLEANAHALNASGRLEFDSGTLELLIEAFFDSPCITRENFVPTLCELIDLFYRLKNETDDRLDDETLIHIMRKRFDSPCEGSVTLLGDLLGRGFR